VEQLLSKPGGPNEGIAFALQLEGELDMKEGAEVGVLVGELWVAPERLGGDGTWSHAVLQTSCS